MQWSEATRPSISVVKKYVDDNIHGESLKVSDVIFQLFWDWSRLCLINFLYFQQIACEMSLHYTNNAECTVFLVFPWLLDDSVSFGKVKSFIFGIFCFQSISLLNNFLMLFIFSREPKSLWFHQATNNANVSWMTYSLRIINYQQILPET